MNISNSIFAFLLLFAVMACNNEEPEPSCDTNTTMINHGGGGSTFCMTASRFNHNIERFNPEHRETYSTYVDLTGLNFSISMDHWTLFEEGQQFTYGAGAAIYSGQWGSVEQFELKIVKLDRVNMLMDITFRVKATALNTGRTSIDYEGFISDMPLTQNPPS